MHIVYEPGPSLENHFGASSIQSVISLVNCNLVKLIQYFTTNNLLDHIIATYAFKYTDSRDHIYSLLGLTRRGPYPITIYRDYNEIAKQVLFDFARSMLIHDQNPYLLSLAPNNKTDSIGNDTRSCKLPS
ncbi:uncharacterized protein B0I36DRAFT_98316 [Microdochium trichocladiopsis]|uniref:Uncharacterized protein n=1 Tax=Microdochium trichocladiopsis TaxID=1682393 RepID=A0A9P9BXD4_9PEZI|nr:uncharacterized protein B0I36DRAFT_98316 [Microdochium trichocladiopsis]KAH7035971.1 hypothetical protein B0I36DRAFT_98316 [Microdochium trichocladiopsis]